MAENWLPRLALLQGACARPPPVSETGARLIMPRGKGGKDEGGMKKAETNSGGATRKAFLHSAFYLLHFQLVARGGSAPPISGCRPDVILFHHRAEIGCRGWNRTSIRAFKGRCPTIRRPGNWWPARVTRPVLRIKSPLHHFNACRPKNGARDRIRTRTGDALDVVPLLIGLHERKLEPPPGVAPSWLPYQRSASLK